MLCIFIKNTILFLLIDFSLFHTESSYHLVIQQRWLLFSGIWCCRGSSLAGTTNFAFHIALSSTCYLCLLGHNSLCGFIYEADFWLSCGSYWIWGSQHHDMSWIFLFHLSLTETIWWSPDTLFLAPVRFIPISHVFTLHPCSDALMADGVYHFHVRPISMCSVKSWSEGGCGIKGSGFSVTSSSDDCPTQHLNRRAESRHNNNSQRLSPHQNAQRHHRPSHHSWMSSSASVSVSNFPIANTPVSLGRTFIFIPAVLLCPELVVQVQSLELSIRQV